LEGREVGVVTMTKKSSSPYDDDDDDDDDALDDTNLSDATMR